MYIICTETHVFLAGKKLSGDFFFQVVEAHLNVSLPSGPANMVLTDLVAACSFELIGEWSDESSANQICTSCKQNLKRPWNTVQRRCPPSTTLSWRFFVLCCCVEATSERKTQLHNRHPSPSCCWSHFRLAPEWRKEGIVSGGSSTTRLDAAQGQHAWLNNCKPFFHFHAAHAACYCLWSPLRSSSS